MSKGTVFVMTYSLILLVLFCTFSYLITTVNPPPIKPDTDRARKFGVDDVFYPSDVWQPNNNLAYGLEKMDYKEDNVIKIVKKKLTPISSTYLRDKGTNANKNLRKSNEMWPQNNVRRATGKEVTVKEITTKILKPAKEEKN